MEHRTLVLIEDYTKTSFVVYGTERECIKHIFHPLGGKWNPRLKCGPGFVFKNDMLDTIKDVLDTICIPDDCVTISRSTSSSSIEILSERHGNLHIISDTDSDTDEESDSDTDEESDEYPDYSGTIYDINEDIKSTIEEQSCVVCLENKKVVANTRCGHLCVCFNCSNNISKTTSKCPLCRIPWDNTIRIFT